VSANRRRCALRAPKRRRRGATLLGRAKPRQPPERSDRPDLRGGAVELSVHDDSLKPGPGIWPLRLAKCQRRGEDGRSPGLRTFMPLRRDKIKRPPSAHQSVGVVNPAARGRSVAHTTERAMRGMRPSLGERGGCPDPASIVPAPTPRSYAPCRSTQPTSGSRSLSGPAIPFSMFFVSR
jgi:hypothetical protein